MNRVQTRLGPSWFDFRDGYRGCGGFRSAANGWGISVWRRAGGEKGSAALQTYRRDRTCYRLEPVVRALACSSRSAKTLAVAMPAGTFVTHFGKQIHYDGAKDEEALLEIVGMGPATSTPAEVK